MYNISIETFKLFINESLEHQQEIEESLLELESQGSNEALINKVFRAAHTIKGAAGFFSFESLKNLAHAMENVLGLFRNREIEIDDRTLTPLFEGSDVLKKMLLDIDNYDSYETKDIIASLQKSVTSAKTVSEKNTLPPVIIDSKPNCLPGMERASQFEFVLSDEELSQLQKSESGGRYIYGITFPCPEDFDTNNINSISLLAELKSMVHIGRVEKFKTDNPMLIAILCSTSIEPTLFHNYCKDFYNIDKDRIKLVSDKLIEVDISVPGKEVSVENAVTENSPSNGKQLEPKPERAPAVSVKSETETIRVNVGHLNRLMTLAGELVLTRNALLKKTIDKGSSELSVITQRVDTITSELQEAIMATRMQSISVVFTKFKRIVRDLAQKLNKKIDLRIEGEDVELDRTIIEAISDPLMHLVRNSTDHGIEQKEKRIASGKKEAGQLLLKASHEAGQVLVEIMDDGAGIDPKRIIEKAIEKNLNTRQELESMSRKEIIRLIFKPGFSTANEVTDISGRGVGMDVVISSLLKVGGTVDVESETGKYTRIIIKLPLTLAIMPSLLVVCSNQRFAIPQVNLVELVRIGASDIKKKVEKIGSWPVMRLRDELLPLIRLSDVLEIPRTFNDPLSGEQLIDKRENIPDRRSPTFDNPEEYEKREVRPAPDRRASRSSDVNIAVVATGAYRYGLIVDQLLDSEEIVVKPLGSLLATCREYAGATILGDGNVALILDIAGVRDTADLESSLNAIGSASEINKRLSKISHDANTYLIIRNAEDEQFCVPLGAVSRIERFNLESLVNFGGQLVVAHEGTTLALLSIEDVAKVKKRKQSKYAFTVIFKVYGREVGILVSEVVDIIDAEYPIDCGTHVQPGILGSIVVDGTITLMLDTHGIVDVLLPEYKKNKLVESSDSTVILIAEDSPFFRKQIKSFLIETGYVVLDAEDGEKGLELLNKNADRVKLIITDIEMPGMDGLEMTRRIRSDGRFSSIPILACTSVSGDLAEKSGIDAGLTEYLIKLDREQILERCSYYLSPVKMAV